MEFSGVKEVGILDDRVFEEYKGIIEHKIPAETVQDEIEKIQKIKQKTRHDAVKKPEEEPSPVKAYYYVLPVKSKNQYHYYIYTPGGVTILRAPQSMLGANVLGTANLKTNMIHILESLYGCAFDEVLKHELNHIKYPHKSEYDIRQMTRSQLTHLPIFH